MGDMTKYFNKSEFACPCGCGFDSIDKDLVFILDKIRVALGHSLTVTSGCRCKEYNDKIGGAIRSAHLKGFAADVSIANSRDRYITTRVAFDYGVTRLGVGSDFIHIDIDKSLNSDRIWTY